MWLNPFFRCACGKLHVGTFVSQISKCRCGRPLSARAWSTEPIHPGVPDTLPELPGKENS